MAITIDLLFRPPVQIAIIPSSKMQPNLLRKKASVATARGQEGMMDRLSDSIDIWFSVPTGHFREIVPEALCMQGCRLIRPRRVRDPSPPTLRCPGQAHVHHPVLLGRALTRASPVCTGRSHGPAAAESQGSLVKGPRWERSHRCPEDHVCSHHMRHMMQAQWAPL